MSNNNYTFLMQEVNSKGKVIDGSSSMDLESDFNGLRYVKAEGLNDYGEAKIYEETYADEERVRAYIPESPIYNQTNVKFTFYIFGENRRQTYDSFVKYVSSGYHRYYDTARKKYLYFYVSDSVSVSEEKWYGSKPYLKFELSVKNMFGRTFDTPL